MDITQKLDDLQVSNAADVEPKLDKLHDHLDSLWVTYLNHLDAYNSAQKLLQKHMSAGFLSLARANFNARNGVRRYGQDYYHERAIATSRVTISAEKGAPKPTVEIVKWSPPTNESDEDSETAVEVEKMGEKDEDIRQLPSPPGTPEPETQPTPNESNSGNEPTSSGATPGIISSEADPLKWFGILVPQALRSSQASFHAALHDAVADTVNSAKGMRSIEVEIRKLRKEIRRAEKRDLAQS